MDHPTSDQEIVDRTIILIVEQGRQSIGTPSSIDDSTACLYRSGPDQELRCAVGHWLPDDAVTPDNNGMTVEDLILSIRRGHPDLAGWLREHAGVLSDLQYLHDLRYNWGSPADLRDAIERFYERHGLPVPEWLTLPFIREHWKLP